MSLLERVAQAETAALQQAEDLRAQLAAVEERLQRLAAGNDMKTTSAMLRHSSISITADLYTTVLLEVAREAAEASAALVPRAVKVTGASKTGGLPSVSQVENRRPADSTGSR
ncbi:hypothetical protein [Nonomuraea fuscirosea]|uniref:hypothetical protein n=1 Tax=Nonomuraea fuscirosea TaxID=1291556 RepID=UPI00343735DB